MNLIRKIGPWEIFMGVMVWMIGTQVSDIYSEYSKKQRDNRIIRNEECRREVTTDGRILPDYARSIIEEDGKQNKDLLEIENDSLVRYIMEINNIRYLTDAVGEKIKLPRYAFGSCFKFKSYNELVKGVYKK